MVEDFAIPKNTFALHVHYIRDKWFLYQPSCSSMFVHRLVACCGLLWLVGLVLFRPSLAKHMLVSKHLRNFLELTTGSTI